MKRVLLFAILLVIFSCQQKETVLKPEDILKSQIENWKKQLLVNGEVGLPCEKDYVKWNAKNTESYYGLPKIISSKTSDANNDKIDDILLYFPAGNSCTGGHDEGSDFLKLIYSNGNQFLDNDNLRDKIASKIKNEFYEQTNMDVKRAIFSITDFNKNIFGTYKLWTLEDPDCCASIEGSFKYNPFTFKIQITHQNVK